MIAFLSRFGLLGTVESAGLPALTAATASDAKRGGFYGPQGPGRVGGAPGEQKLYSRLLSVEEAQRVWRASEELTRVKFQL